MRLLGNQLERIILLLLQHPSHRNFDDAQKLMRQQVQTKINGDRHILSQDVYGSHHSRQDVHGTKSRATSNMMAPRS